MDTIRILIVDDHQVVREGLRRMLELDADLKVVGEAGDAKEVLTQVELLSPEVILMDIKMPGVDGIEITRQLKEKYPSCNVIMLTFYDEYLTHAMEAGARGYLLKDTKREELVQAIRRVHRGEVVLSEAITSKPHNGHDMRYGDKVVAGLQQRRFSPDTMLEEVLLVLPPPVEANQLMRFATQVEEILNSRVLQVVGSWQEGTAVTIILNNALPLADILNKLRGISGIKTIGEEPLTAATSPKLLKKATARPRLTNRLTKALFVTIEKDSIALVS